MKKLRDIVEGKREKLYHSVFYKNKETGKWQHHFDADNKEDAEDERRSLRDHHGEQSVRLCVPQSQANWTKIDPHEYVMDRLSGAKHMREDTE